MPRLILGAWAGLAASVLAALLLEGSYGTGQGIGQMFAPDALRAALHSRFGQAVGVRLLLVIIALVGAEFAVSDLVSHRRRVATAAGWAVLTAALAATWAVADHAGTGMQVALAIPADVIHLCAAAMWIGGLAVLSTVVLRPAGTLRKSGRLTRRRLQEQASTEAAAAVIRFSPIALGCVGLIVATGTYQAWRGLGSWGALMATAYGHLLLAKITGMCTLIGLGYLARRVIAGGLVAPAARATPTAQETAPVRVAVGTAAGANRPRPPSRTAVHTTSAPAAATRRVAPGPDRTGVSLRRLRWSVTIEVAIAMIILAVTALLVNTPPGRQSFVQPATGTAAFDTGGPGGQGSFRFDLSPARAGPNHLSLSIHNRSGVPYPPQETTVELWLPERRLGPLTVSLTGDGSGRYHADQVTIAVPGRWQLRVTIRSDPVDEATTTVPVTIR